MSEPVTQGVFFETMAQLRKDFEDRHRTLRADLHQSFRELGDKFDEHAKDDQAVEKRVLVIETERRGESLLATKRGVWAGILASAGVTGGVQLIKTIWK